VLAFVTTKAQFSESKKMVMKEKKNKTKKIVGERRISKNSIISYVVSVLLGNAKLASTYLLVSVIP
jgi:hypothetical protein